MTLTIPEWVVWLVGVVLGVALLALSVVGALFVFDKGPVDW